MTSVGHRPGAVLVGVVVLAVLAALVSVGVPAARRIAGRVPGSAGGQAASVKPRVGELPERASAVSTTRRNRNGSLTTTVYASPVNYRDERGVWRRIDAGLHPDGADGFAWRSGANAFTARFKSRLDAGFTQFATEGSTVRVTAEGAAAVPARRAGSRVAYPGAYRGADLTYVVGASGTKELIDLAGPGAPASYTFRLSPAAAGDPLSVRRRPDGSYWVTAASSARPLFVLGAPLVREAPRAHGVTPPAADADARLRVRQSGSDLLVTVGLSERWLRAPGRRFPVQVDPTMEIQPNADDGSYVTQADQWAWTDERLYIGSTNTQTLRSALQFDLGTVPAGAQVSDAKLDLYYDQWCVDPAGRCMNQNTPMDAHRMTAPWTSSATTTNGIAFDPTPAGSYTLPAGAGQGWMAWPITSTVQGWLSGTTRNYGLLVKTSTEALGWSGPNPPGMRFTGEASLQPKLEITYTGDGVELLAPTTVHGNGAELAWTAYTGPSGAPFAKYEIHRGTGNFTPSAQTLIATIGDQTVTTFRDTTAAPGRTYTYRVVANTSPSNARTVTLPAAGQARTVLQPDPATGRNTYLHYSTTSTVCKNYGIADEGWVGTSASAIWRDALYFDVRAIPASATITAATASVWEQIGPSAAMTVEAHAITRDWKEGTDWAYCSADGATWYETDGGRPWTTPGGDIDTAVAATAAVPAGDDIRFRDFPITALVQDWVNGARANNGFLLRAADETLRAGNSVMFSTDDYTGTPALRPKLTVTYTEPAASQAPTASVSAPAAGAVVSGSTVRLAAAAADDGKLTKVELKVDGSVVAAPTTAPWQTDWDSTTAANGSHTITATAYDDAGNNTTSPAVTVTVDNAGPPTGTVTATAGSPSGTFALSSTATPTGTKTISSVAFLVDGVRVGTPDTAAPYSLSWNSLDPILPFYNGAHQVTAAITDSNGLTGVTAPVTVTVNNAGTTVLKAGYTLNNPADTTDDVFPATMGENTAAGVPQQDPYAGVTNPDGTSGGSLNRALGNPPQNDGGTPPASCPANAYCPTVNVTNTSGTTWTNSAAQVWYRWYAPNGAIMFEGKSATAFPVTFAANQTQAFPLTVYPPALPQGVQQSTYQLRIDIWDPATTSWLSAKGNPPVENPVIVAKNLATKLGLERYYQYDGGPVGAGMSTLTNVANGDMLLRWSPFYAPGRGLSTMVDLTYNTLEDHSRSPVGSNFSLSMSGLARLGQPIDIHPNKADQISGRSNKWVEVIDGDGTLLHFDGTTGTDGVTRWTEPPGVNLYLRSLTGDPNRVWAFTRPDKVTYYFDADGFPTSVEDRNGNKITYTYEDTPPGEDPGGPKKRITTVTDAGGRTFLIDYWSKAEAKKAHVRGNIQSIADHSGSKLLFDYYDDGNLLRLTQQGGTNADGTFLPDRSFAFTYTTNKGDGPAIATAAARQDPEPKTPNQSTTLFSVIDPRQHETTYAYYLAPDGAQLKWKLKSRTDRDGQVTGYGYDLTNRVTTVTAPLSRVTKYTYDTAGKVTSIVNPKNETTGVQWTADYKVAQVTEPTGKFSSFTYNANGYPLTRTDQLGNTTALTYADTPVDGNDTGNHLSLLATVTSPNGVATTGDATDYRTTYSYDTAGNPDKVTDPTGAVTDYDYNLAGSAAPGTLAAVHDANGNPPTTYPTYDPSGQPTTVVDPLGATTKVGYDLDGNVTWVQDPNHAGFTGTDERAYKSFFDYDSFGRLGRQSAPRSTIVQRGALIWSSADYDANDNVIRSMAAHDGTVGSDPDNGSVTATAFDVMDRQTQITGPDTSADPAGERTAIVYDAAGRTSKVIKPRGVQSATVDDFTTVLGYDPLDRVISQTVYGSDTSTAQTRLTQMCYDLAGDLRSVTQPRAGLTPVTCPGDGPATASFTTTTTYDAAHRQLVQRDPLGHQQSTTYDRDGNVVTSEGDIATGRVSHVETDYDQVGRPITNRERFDAATGRVLTSRVFYDKNGNATKTVSPRAADADAGAGTYTYYTAVNTYDADNRLTRTQLPYDSRDGTERQYVHTSYDANGNVVWTSLPTTQSDPNQVGAGAKTVMTYFDPGWIRTSDDPANPVVHFDYTAQGWQSQRTAEKGDTPGTLDTAHTMIWEYYPDGTTKLRKNRSGQPIQFTYDADNNQITARNTGGVNDPSEKPIETQSTFDGFDQIAKTRNRKTSGNWTFTAYTYDQDGNVSVRLENGQEDDNGTQTTSPRRYELTYDGADWLTQQLDLGTDSACKADTRTITAYWANGLEKQRDTYRAGTGCASDPTTWPKKQTTTWTHFDNSKLRQLTTTNGSGTTTETHTVGYFDAGNVYVNGNRTSDHYGLTRGTGSTATTCLPSAQCDAKYVYDARDRLIHDEQRAGKNTDYTFDEPDKQFGDTTVRAGNVTTQTANGQTTIQRYKGGQLVDVSKSGVTAKYWYDPWGDVDCVTASAGSQADCTTGSGTTTSANLVTDYHYDDLLRLDSVRQYSGGAQTDSSSYVLDAMDRTTTETEDHAGTGNDRTTQFTYQGLSNLTTQEKQTGGADPRTKTYSYDSFGHRLGMTDQATGSTGDPTPYSYGNDVHGSISQLIDDAGGVKASYGYTPYGGTDATDSQALTSGDTNNQAPLNPMRYSGKRIDSGTATSTSAQPDYDMGARRFGPGTGRFLQQDAFSGALADLGLATDPLTQNRYALASGNPISNVETDGHMVAADGGGGGSPSTAPPPPDPKPAEKSDKSFLGNLKSFGSGIFDAGKETVKGLGQLGYDTFIGSSPFVDKQTQEETRARAKARGDAFKHPSQLWNAISSGYKEDISKGDYAHAAGRAVFDIGTMLIGGEGSVSKLGKLGKVGKVGDVGKAGDVAATAGRGDSLAGKAGRALDDCTHSFRPDTRVLMADGTTKKIKDIRVGDKVLAKDTKTGRTTARAVAALHVNDDTDLATVTVKTPSGAIAVLNTTQHHPFWDSSTGTWTQAAGLQNGHTLGATGGATMAMVLGVRSYTGAHEMRDLTVTDDHTYYVLVGTTPVLVHNCGGAYARGVGNSKPSPQKAHLDFDENGQVVPGQPPTPKGMSTYDSLEHLNAGFSSNNPVYRISQDTLDNLPDGLAHARDGGIGDIPEGHITIYPTESMSFSRFTKLIKGLGWDPVG